MRIKITKILITAFIVLLCSIILIGGKFYVKTVQSFRTFYNFSGVELMSNTQNSGYNELKQSIIDKYTKEFVNLLNGTSSAFKEDISKSLGYDYSILSEEYVTISDSINSKKQAYFLSDEFLSARKTLEELKTTLDGLSNEEKDKYLDEFRVALNAVSTLNTKLNNSLKSERERLDLIKGQVLSIFIKNRKQLLEIRSKYVNEMRVNIANLISNFNAELKELNIAFDVQSNKTEYPFDVETMQDFSLAGKLETDCFNELLDNKISPLVSENSVKLQS